MAIALAAAASPALAHTLPPVAVEVEVDRPATEIWDAWTTPAGVRTFFAPQAHIDARVGGAYEIYFLPDQPEGLKGSEGATILAFEKPSRLMFSWNAPVTFGELRNQLTVVEVRLDRVEESRTRVVLTHSGWGVGDEWAGVRAYFAKAWPIVLERLKSGEAMTPAS